MRVALLSCSTKHSNQIRLEFLPSSRLHIIMVLLILPALLVISFAAFYLYMTRHFNYWKERNVPYLKPTPFVGNFGPVFRLQKSIGQLIADFHHASEDPYTGFFTVDKPSLLIRNLHLIKQILVQDFNYFPDRNLCPNAQVEPLGAVALFALKGDEWRNMRAKLTPNFTPGKTRSMFPLVHACAKDMDPLLSQYASGKEDFDVKDLMARFTTDIVSVCGFGLEGESLRNPDSEFRQIGRAVFYPGMFQSIKMGLMVFAPEILKFLRLRVMSDMIYAKLRRIIWSTIHYREKHSVRRGDFLDLLMDIRKETLEEKKKNPAIVAVDGDILVGQTFAFLIAAFETSSTAMSLALFELALQPHLQDKLRAEISNVLTKHGGEVTFDALQEMTYLHQVLSETLRKYPTLPFIDRQCAKPYRLPGTDLVIEPGMKVFLSLSAIQNDPQIFPDPDRFDPDRFTETAIAERTRFTYFPFGEGPRNCIGMRFGQMLTRVGLVHVLRDYAVEPCAQTPTRIKINPKSFALGIDGPLLLRLVKLQS